MSNHAQYEPRRPAPPDRPYPTDDRVRADQPGVRADPVYVVKAAMFRTLGHPIRIRILELLCAGECTVGELQASLGLDSSGTSQHLTALRHQGIVDKRRLGTSSIYSVKDEKVASLLAVAKEILTCSLADSASMLDTIERAPAEPAEMTVESELGADGLETEFAVHAASFFR